MDTISKRTHFQLIEAYMRRIKKCFAAISALSKAARFYKTSLWFQASRAKRLHDRSLFSLEDVLFWGLTDPGIPVSSIDNFISREARTRLLRHVNRPESRPDVDDKARFYYLCQLKKLPIPETFGILKTDRRVDSIDKNEYFDRISLDEIPDGNWVAKPILGMKGKGLVFFGKKSDEYLIDAKTLDQSRAESYFGQLDSHDELIVQRRVDAHPDLVPISLTTAVQSVRIVTYLDANLRVHILFSRFKFIRKDNDVDNFDDGKQGNLISDVDTESGRITGAKTKNPGELGLQPVSHHPDSNLALDIVLPDWPKTIELATKAALEFPQLRTLAWDIALTPGGPVILEGNQEWETFPFAPYQKPSPIGDWEMMIK